MGRTPTPIEDDNWKIASTEMPVAPDAVSGDAKQEWNRIGKYLVGLDRVAAVDRQGLTAYCTQWGCFSRIMKTELAESHVQLFTDGPSCDIPHPLIPPLVRSAKAAIKLAGQFGLTARTRDLESDHGNRKASALKKLMGNQRKVAESKVGPRTIIPMVLDWTPEEMLPPFWVNNRVSQEYKLLGEQLENMDLFTPLDVVPLTIACCLFDLYLRAGEQMQSLYTSVFDKHDNETYQKEHPLLRVQLEIHDTLQAVWKDYGQTPRYRKVFNGERKTERKEVPLIFKGRFAEGT
jgi:phage terminase small subunit